MNPIQPGSKRAREDGIDPNEGPVKRVQLAPFEMNQVTELAVKVDEIRGNMVQCWMREADLDNFTVVDFVPEDPVKGECPFDKWPTEEASYHVSCVGLSHETAFSDCGAFIIERIPSEEYNDRYRVILTPEQVRTLWVDKNIHRIEKIEGAYRRDEILANLRNPNYLGVSITVVTTDVGAVTTILKSHQLLNFQESYKQVSFRLTHPDLIAITDEINGLEKVVGIESQPIRNSILY